MSIFTSKDSSFEGYDKADSKKLCQRLSKLGPQELRHMHKYSQIYEPHSQSWAELWAKADIFIEVPAHTRSYPFSLNHQPSPQIGGRIRPISPICSADLLGS